MPHDTGTLYLHDPRTVECKVARIIEAGHDRGDDLTTVAADVVNFIGDRVTESLSRDRYVARPGDPEYTCVHFGEHLGSFREWLGL